MMSDYYNVLSVAQRPKYLIICHPIITCMHPWYAESKNQKLVCTGQMLLCPKIWH